MKRDLREKLIQIIDIVCDYKKGKDNPEMNTRNRRNKIYYKNAREKRKKQKQLPVSI